MLILTLDAKEGEKHEKNKQIIHRQRFLNEITCQEFHRFLVGIIRVEQLDASTEYQ